ncbi:MAG: hypothetical protein Q9219_007592 [cf. Caloplaca sp. 3 TL-2023]
MSEAWFREQIAPNGVIEDGCHPDEARTLQSYLNNQIDPRDAAHAIIQPILSSNDPGANLHRLWNLLQDALVELSAAYVLPLINLLKAIQDLPDPDLTTESNSTATTLPKSSFTWKGLPQFGHLWADVHKQDDWRNNLSATLSSYHDLGDRLKNRQELRAAHAKKANIEARLAVANVGSIPLDWGYDAIADALELDVAVLDFEIPAAKHWIEVAGKELYQGAKDGRESWALNRKRNREREEVRMSVGRWEFWEGRMREFQEIGKVVEDAGYEAGKEMRRLEETGTQI